MEQEKYKSGIDPSQLSQTNVIRILLEQGHLTEDQVNYLNTANVSHYPNLTSSVSVDDKFQETVETCIALFIDPSNPSLMSQTQQILANLLKDDRLNEYGKHYLIMGLRYIYEDVFLSQ
jgi:hypothetical protein